MISDIKKDFETILTCTQDEFEYVNFTLDPLFKQWEQKKLGAFGDIFTEENNYRYQSKTPISIDIPASQKEAAYSAFVSDVYNSFAFSRIGNEEKEKAVAFYDFLTKQSIETVYSNRLKKDYNNVVKAGMVFGKSFKHFLSAEQDVRFWQDRLSILLQQTKLEGYLTISANPIDFVLASDNNYGWRSCHSLNGEFRAGNLGFMVDDVTLICYLSNKVGVEIGETGVVAPDKKWRQWVYTDRKNFVYPESYPYLSEGLTQAVHDLMPFENKNNKQFTKKSFPPPVIQTFEDSSITLLDYEDFLNTISKECFFYAYNDVIFKDCCRTTVFTSDQEVEAYFNKLPVFKIEAEGSPLCPICGRNGLGEAEYLCCESCGGELGIYGVEECYCCGERIPVEHLMYYDGEMYCEDCYLQMREEEEEGEELRRIKAEGTFELDEG